MTTHPLSRSLCRPQTGMRVHAGRRDYVLQGALGDGAVGLVRKARDVVSGAQVAIKFLAPDPKYIDPTVFEDVADRFRREGLRGTGLHNEHLVRIIAHEDNVDGSAVVKRAVRNPFLVMELVPGRTLESLIRHLDSKSPTHITRQTLAIAAALARALQHLHERKLVHRDVKPANVFLSTTRAGATPSIIKLGDFGVTKWGDFLAATTTGTLTVTSQQGLGTLKYMSPEQATRPKEVTVKSDMFSLGITLFELFTGRILLSPHHVYEIVNTRHMRGTGVGGRLLSLGLPAGPGDVAVFEPILEMFLAASGRPTSKQIAGRFEFLAERLSPPTA